MPKKKHATDDPLILLVDDVEDNLDVYTQFFLHNGWRTVTAANGPAALVQASELWPAVMILDLGMPGMDGWEVARRIRTDPATAGIRSSPSPGTSSPTLAAGRKRRASTST